VEDAAFHLECSVLLLVTNKLDIASLKHPKERTNVAGMHKSISGLGSDSARPPFFALLDADVGKAVEDAIGVSCRE